MKTIDEVITALEDEGVFPDALHYLKEYRSDKAMWEADRKGYLDWIEQYKEAREKHQQAVIELKKNPPLTWEELKTMEGKPVWVELGLLRPRWYLIEGFNGDQMVGVDALSVRVPFYKDDIYTGGWQAYRKERE
jgi:hypothetical protein